jgi:hypothetical protein
MHLACDVSPESGAIKVNFPGLMKTDEEMVEARMGWLSRRTTTEKRGRYVLAKVLMGGVWFKSAGYTEAQARARLEKRLRPVVTSEETTLDLTPLRDTCALDVADRGPQELQTIGDLANIVMERVRQIEETALDDARASAEADGWAEAASPERAARVHAASSRLRRELREERSREYNLERLSDLLSARLAKLEPQNAGSWPRPSARRSRRPGPLALATGRDAHAQDAQPVIEEACGEPVPRRRAG